MKVQIGDIQYQLPRQVITNADLARENPSWDMERIAAKSGVLERRIAEPGETTLDLAARAADRLFRRCPSVRRSVDAVLFCTQSPDYVMPSNAFLLHRHLRLPEGVLAFDFTLACSGFVYGLELARSFIVAGRAKTVLLATGDTYSRFINKKDRSARVLFGDGAAVSLVVPTASRGIVDSLLSTSGKDYDKFYIPAGGTRLPRTRLTGRPRRDSSGNIRSQDDILMDGMAVWNFISRAVPEQINTLLKRNRLKLADIDLFVFHQASRMTLDSLVSVLGIDERRVMRNMERIGNTVSASIPIALKDALDAGRLRRGDRVLLSGFGVGLSWASMLVEY